MIAAEVLVAVLGWCVASVVTGLVLGRLIARNAPTHAPQAGRRSLPAWVTPADHRIRELLGR